MKKLLLFVGFLLYFFSYSQLFERIGYYTDPKGQPIDDYFDFTYSPESPVEVFFTLGDGFTPGYYVDLSGVQKDGEIKFVYDAGTGVLEAGAYFYYRVKGSKEKTKIRAEECSRFVIGTRVFETMKEVQVERALGGFEARGLQFVELLKRVDDLTFYKHVSIGNTVVTTYMVKSANGAVVTFPRAKKEFQAVALTYFGKIDYLKRALKDDMYRSEDLPELIHYLHYYNKFTRDEKIGFTSSWDETDSLDKMEYFAEVMSCKSNKWVLRYYDKAGTALYEGSYSALNPLERSGVFTFWYPDGKLRKTAMYKEDELADSLCLFYPNGKLHYSYVVKSKKPLIGAMGSGKKGESSATPAHSYKCIGAYDYSGFAFLDEKGNGTEVFYDTLRQVTVTKIFESGRLEVVYTTDASGKKVYSKYKNLVGYYNTMREMEDIPYPYKSVKENTHGMVLVRIGVDNTGTTTYIKLVRGVDDACNSKVLGFCKAKYEGKCWIVPKVDGQRVEQEVIVPFVFELFNPSATPKRYYNYTMMNNQFMKMPVPTAPRF